MIEFRAHVKARNEQVHEMNSAFIRFDELSDKDNNWQKLANQVSAGGKEGGE